MKKTRVSHSTSAIASSTVTLVISTSSPAPSRAMTAGSLWITGLSTNPTITTASTTRLCTSSRRSRIASRSESAITSATRSGS